MTTHLSYDLLMRACRDESDPVTRALAGALASAAGGIFEAPGLGLDGARLQTLLVRHFPNLDGQFCAGQCEGCRPLRNDEFDDLVALLVEHRSHDREEIEWLAHAIASACMGGNHLYQDMGLPNRQALSDLLRQHFTDLFEKNASNMKWKKFFYKQLCDEAQAKICQTPSCQVCNDYWNCFGPEDESFPVALAVAAGRAPNGTTA